MKKATEKRYTISIRKADFAGDLNDWEFNFGWEASEYSARIVGTEHARYGDEVKVEVVMPESEAARWAAEDHGYTIHINLYNAHSYSAY